jgi:hypothetical protein
MMISHMTEPHFCLAPVERIFVSGRFRRSEKMVSCDTTGVGPNQRDEQETLRRSQTHRRPVRVPSKRLQQAEVGRKGGGASGRVLGQPLLLGAENDRLRRIALTWFCVAARSVVAERAGCLGEVSRFHDAGCTHHYFLGAAHRGFAYSAVYR